MSAITVTVSSKAKMISDFIGPRPHIVKRMGEIAPMASRKAGAAFQNDGSYASVEALLHKVAINSFKRVQALNLPMSFEDVRQEMNESYLRAFKAWDPQRGVKFSSYCQAACMMNFRHRIEKMANERREMGMYSYDDRAPIISEETGDPLERISTELDIDHARPEDRLAARQEMREKLKGLTPSAQRFVTALLMRETTPNVKGGGLRFSSVAISAGIRGAELNRVKQEITEKFGFTEW